MINLGESEYRFASIVWEHEPIASGELVKRAEVLLKWKKSTTYTVLKKLCEKNILKNENAIVTAIVKKEEVQKFQSEQLIEKTFSGSLPSFIASFMSDKKLSQVEAEEIKMLIDSYKEGGK